MNIVHINFSIIHSLRHLSVLNCILRMKGSAVWTSEALVHPKPTFMDSILCYNSCSNKRNNKFLKTQFFSLKGTKH